MRTVTFITATCLCLLFCYVCQCCEGDDTLSFSSRICRCIMQWILVLYIVISAGSLAVSITNTALVIICEKICNVL